MLNVSTYSDLTRALQTGEVVRLPNIPYDVTLQAIERDGSGHCFNVRVLSPGKDCVPHMVFFRTMAASNVPTHHERSAQRDRVSRRDGRG